MRCAAVGTMLVDYPAEVLIVLFPIEEERSSGSGRCRVLESVQAHLDLRHNRSFCQEIARIEKRPNPCVTSSGRTLGGERHC